MSEKEKCDKCENFQAKYLRLKEKMTDLAYVVRKGSERAGSIESVLYGVYEDMIETEG